MRLLKPYWACDTYPGARLERMRIPTCTADLGFEPSVVRDLVANTTSASSCGNMQSCVPQPSCEHRDVPCVRAHGSAAEAAQALAYEASPCDAPATDESLQHEVETGTGEEGQGK